MDNLLTIAGFLVQSNMEVFANLRDCLKIAFFVMNYRQTT